MVYVKLWNGHKPGQLPDDCGEDGPVFGPYDNVQVTYGGHVKMWSEDACDDLAIGANGWITYDGVLYGDFTVTCPQAEAMEKALRDIKADCEDAQGKRTGSEFDFATYHAIEHAENALGEKPHDNHPHPHR